MRKIYAIVVFSIIPAVAIYAQDVYSQWRGEWLQLAESYTPKLIETKCSPKQLVEIVADDNGYQGLASIAVNNPGQLSQQPIKKDKAIIIDFGKHVTGYLSLYIRPSKAAHAPLKLKFTFGEMPVEMSVPFDSYKGDLASSWLQEGTLIIDDLPDTVKLERRYSFRYLKIEHISSPSDLEYFIDDIYCTAVSSAGEDQYGSEMDEEPDEMLNVSMNTLSECMQTVFEDGPKRDRRIWIGDFKLEALANYYSFRNLDLVKRGLFLFAATADTSGLVYGTLFERPYPHPEKHFPIDYCLLYNTIVNDYLVHTRDTQTVRKLWPVVKEQINIISDYIDEKGEFHPASNWWYFIDWNPKLDKRISLHGAILYSLNKSWELAQSLGKEDEFPRLPEVISSMKHYARSNYYNKEKGLYVGLDSQQVSVASQVWMILAEVNTQKESRKILKRLMAYDEKVMPVSPYMYHYFVEALFCSKLNSHAQTIINDYWGAMVKKGADTFWEVYDPNNEHLSPYGSTIMNSYCHAWSCTPVYFLRKYSNSIGK